MYKKTKKKYILMIKREFKYWLPHKAAHSLIYFRNKKKKINWKLPITYDEKIHWLMVYLYDNSYGLYADKYLVREYVKQCGLEKLLIPLLGVYNNASEIKYEELPNRFILKTTHGSGEMFYVICSDKSMINIEQVNLNINNALNEKFYKNNCEYQYEKIKPRIICEQLLDYGNGKYMDDYKVVCANGNPVAILVCKSRDEGRDYYSVEWEYLDYVYEQYRSEELTEKPQVLDEMLHAASILSKPFPLARIDFYIVNDKLYFGEITLTPSAGNHVNLNEIGQKELGKSIILPKLRMN